MIKILNDNEKIYTREIWEQIFTEDTKQFLDYYYSEKTKDNYIFSKNINENIVSMLHLNPYEIYMNNNILKTYYIVAVATLKDFRKKGYMAELLNNCINFMNKEKIPFTFLRPAKEEIYLPFDFKYVYNHNILELKENSNLDEIQLTKDKYEFVSNFINKLLNNKYNVFSNRTYKYIDKLHKEVKSENGDINLLYKNNKFIGCHIYWGANEKITRAVFSNDDIFNIKNVKPLVMARIINLNEFFKNITSKNDELELILNLNDNIIKENNGIFQLNINKNYSNIKKADNINVDNILNINIANLTSLFFGYEKIDKFTNNQSIINKFKDINLYNMFFDEEV